MKDDQTQTLSSSSLHSKTPQLYMYFIAAAVIMGLLLSLFLAIAGSDDEQLSHYDAARKFTAENMSYEQRAAAVAAWTKDIAETIEPSRDLNSYMANVEMFTDDKMVSAGEYILINDGYDQLKSYTHFDDINESVKLVQANSGEAPASTLVIDEAGNVNDPNYYDSTNTNDPT